MNSEPKIDEENPPPAYRDIESSIGFNLQGPPLSSRMHNLQELAIPRTQGNDSAENMETAQLARELGIRALKSSVVVVIEFSKVGVAVGSVVGTALTSLFLAKRTSFHNPPQFVANASQLPFPNEDDISINQRLIPHQESIHYRRISYWDPITDLICWKALLYMIFINFPVALFCFLWIFITLFASAVLLIIFPIGYPILFLSSLSWRLLAKLEMSLLGVENTMSFWIDPVGQYQNDFFPFKRHIMDKNTMKSAVYFLFCKLFQALWGVIIGFFMISLFIPMFCLVPILLSHLKYLYRKEKFFCREWFVL